MTPAKLHEIRDRHWGEGNIPEHDLKLLTERNGCDACHLLRLIDAQTRLLSKALGKPPR